MAIQPPKTMSALVIESTETSPIIKKVPTPEPVHGSVVVEVLVANIISYTRDIYNGDRAYPFPMPLVGGSSAIGRIAAVGPDATKLEPGDLVHINSYIRSRDDQSDGFLAGIHQGFTQGSVKLMHDVWRDWTYAEYCRAPLENCFRLNEQVLTGKEGFSYSYGQLAYLATVLVPYGGLKAIGLQAGEILVIGPATGQFGSAAVIVALAMGAKVIALGRNQKTLAAIKQLVSRPELLETTAITGNVETELEAIKKAAGGPVDAFLDIGPSAAAQSSHVKAGILSLRRDGRASLMSGYRTDISMPYSFIMNNNIHLQGKWMYEPADVRALIRMIETGVLKLDLCQVTKFPLDDFENAWTVAAEDTGITHSAVFEL